jgi:hypothetical protein
MERQRNIITGLWKFKDSIDIREIEQFANELAQDEHFIHVYIRKASKDQEGLGITYKADNEFEQEDFQKFMEDMKDKIYKKFGSGLVGWDFSSSTATIKGF